ncbi:MAG: pilus assembly PilX N-terminal domain-containing protein [Patescibacteria group bacterium]
MHRTKRLTGNEQGFVSMVVAMTLIIILALLTVGFAQLARREQKQALDKQLSVQAKYAAESGINDVVEAIQRGTINDTTPEADGKTCINNIASPPAPLVKDINITSATKYTCVLVKTDPDSLQYDSVLPEVPHYTSFTTKNAISNAQEPMTELIVQWESPNKFDNNNVDHHPNYPPPTVTNQFIPFDQWNSVSTKYPSVIEFGFTQFDKGSTDQATLINNQFVTYLYPSTGAGGSINYTGKTGSGAIVNGNCPNTEPHLCKATINIPAVANSKYLIHFLPHYNTANFVITAKGTSGRLAFVGAQVKVDSTGKAQDVLKRLQVRVKPKPPLPDFPIESQNTCKRQTTEPGSTKFIASNGANASAGNDPFCIPN